MSARRLSAMHAADTFTDLREVRVARRRLHLPVAEHLADDRQALPQRKRGMRTSA